MKIKKKLVIISLVVAMTMSLFMLTGCGDKAKPVNSLNDLVEFSVDKIASIHISENDGKPSVIDNKEEIKKICDSLSLVTVKDNPGEIKINKKNVIVGGSGNYILVVYKSGQPCHIKYSEAKGEIQFTGNTKNGEIKDKWSVYKFSDVAQLKAVEEITSPLLTK